MDKLYFSVDVETSGPTPGKYSMLSIGACVVGDTSKQFYREIKPISRNFNEEAMKIVAKGLKCLDKFRHLEEFNPQSEKFNPKRVLEVLDKRGETPQKVMKDYASWIEENSRGFRAIETAAPIKFDGMFTAWYFDNFYTGRNPLSFSGEDINSMYRGATKNLSAHITDLGIRGEDLPHNALEDAIIQAKEMKKVLDLLV